MGAVTNMLRSRSSAERQARDKLREAIAARRMAELALQAKVESSQRLERIIAAAAAAEQAAAQAQAAAHEGAVAWAAAGAADGDNTHAESIEHVAERRRAADIAVIRAHGAQQALPAAKEAVEEAQRACERAAERIPSAVGALLVALCEPDLAKLAAARRQYLEIYNQVRGALETEAPPGWDMRGPAAGLAPLRDRLTALAMPKYAAWGSHSDVPGFEPDRWTAFAQKLASDADAAAD